MRTEFSAKVKAQAALRAGGKCEECGRRLLYGEAQYDHEIPDALGGMATLENCRVVCKSCHKAKTATVDAPRISKARRNFRTANGIKNQRSITRWRNFRGQIVIAPRER